MARKRASMREGPLAELFRATEAAQRQAERGEEAAPPPAQTEPNEATVEHVPTFEDVGIDEPAPPIHEPGPPRATTSPCRSPSRRRSSIARRAVMPRRTSL
jgi:hypothetical protein